MARVLDSHVTPGDTVVWLLLATSLVVFLGWSSRFVLRLGDAEDLSQHERANQTTTWVLVALVVGLLAISSILAMMVELA